MNRREPGRRLPSGLIALACAATLVSAGLIATTRGGWQLQVVRSESMSPAVPRGALLIMARADPATIREGDVVSFEDPLQPGRLVAHRVESVVHGSDGLFFLTKGDANPAADVAPVPARLLRGRLRAHVPYLGRGLELLAWPRGFLLLVVFPILLLSAGEIRRLVRRRANRSAAASP